jgi:signal transduction histidine kinase
VRLVPDALTQIAIPLVSRDQIIGILNLESHRSGVFTEQTQEFLKLITARIAVAIDNSRLYRQTATQLKELQSLYDRVRKLEQLKTDMIRIASHDLRNPLMTIKGYVNILQEDVTDPSTSEYLGYIDSAAGTMRRITTDILSLERIEEAAQNGNFTLFDFKSLIEEVYLEQSPQAKLKNQTLKTQISAERFMLEGDPVQLKEAVANFISNAIKYTPEKGVVIIRLFKREDRLIFEVEDNGYGIPEVQQARLFQPFFRSRSPETKEIEGTGLGLHLVKNIIERHGGTVFFTSVHGKGSTFGFDLPMETGVVG